MFMEGVINRIPFELSLGLSVSLVLLLGLLHLYTDNSETFLGDLWMSAFLPLFHFLSFSLNVLSALFSFSVDLALSVSSLKSFFSIVQVFTSAAFSRGLCPCCNVGLILQPISLNASVSLLGCLEFFFLFKLIPSYLLLTCSKISPRCPIKVKTSKHDEVNGKTPSASKDGVWFAQLSDSLLCSWALLLFINHGFHISKYLWLCSHNLGELRKGKKKKRRGII